MAFAVLEFFAFCVFSFGSGYTSCKAYDDGLGFKDTSDKYGICESSWLVTIQLAQDVWVGLAPGLWRRTVAVKSPFAHFGVGCCWLSCCCCCSRILNHMSCCVVVESLSDKEV